MAKSKILAFLFLSFLFLFSCKNKTTTVDSNPELFNNYVTGYSASPVSRCSSIYVDLGFRVGDDVTIPDDILRLEPSIGGVAMINDDRNRITIVGGKVKHNIKYRATFDIDKLTKMPQGLEQYSFNVEAQRQAWDIEMQAPISKSMEVVSLHGKMKFGVCEPSLQPVEDALTATQDGRKLKISFFTKLNRDYRGIDFSISGIKRKDDASSVKLILSMEPLNVDDKAEMSIHIPSKSDFSFHSLAYESNKHLILSFTDPIKTDQVLDGLIKVSGRRIKNMKVHDNSIDVFFENVDYGEFKLNILPGIKNIAGFKLKDATERILFFAPPKPSVKIAEEGHILPPTGHWDLPISLVTASGFRMRILKVYKENAHRFYQENDNSLSSQTGLENIGRIVFDSTFVIDKPNVFIESHHAIVLDKQIKKEQGALYKVFLTIPFEHNKYPIDKKPGQDKDVVDAIDFDRPSIRFNYYEDYDYYIDYNSNIGHRSFQDPSEYTKNSKYYIPNPSESNFETFIHDQRLLICSDIGVVVKSEPSKNRFFTYVSKITNANPIAGAKVELQNFQGKIIASGTTDGNGFSSIYTEENPYLIRASKNGQFTYLPVSDAKAISMSTFQVEGKDWGVDNKVFFYGDRNVWRPGDTVFMNSMVFHNKGELPNNLPINLTLYDPTNKLVKKWTVKTHQNGLYDCRFVTDATDLTGHWRLEMNLGGTTYQTNPRIETIKPNRLKMQMLFENDKLLTNKMSLEAPVEVKWMHGLEAKGLKTEVNMLQKSLKNPFGANYKNYVFDDLRKRYEEEIGLIHEGSTNEAGVLDLTIPTEEKENYPSMMLFNFELRAYEKGGAFSTDMKAIKYSPYDSYVGVKFPGGMTDGRIYLDRSDAIQIACLDQYGKPISQEVEVSVVKIKYKWWYQYGSQGNYAAINNNIGKNIETYKMHIPREGASINMHHDGRFLVTITDLKSGHSVNRVVYSYHDNFYSDGGGEVAQLEVLPFLIEKDTYKVGELLSFDLPAFDNGRYLITVESGGEIVYKQTRKSKSYPENITIAINANMTPTAYVHVHFIQGWSTHNNDRPLRLFGIKPIKVYDSNTVLSPIITMNEEIRADKYFDVEISEKDNKIMTYTLAIVDEGLLDITQFRTPNPWNSFFAKERLQTKTWDMYRDVFQRFLGEYSSLLAIGGDGANTIKSTVKAQRFKPAVKFLGPFTLRPGERKKHHLKISDYVGSVRAMVVATNGHAFGHNEFTAPVKKPLMLYTTMPRVLGPGETLKVPVTVFAMKEDVKNVDVTIETNNMITIEGKKSQNLTFSKVGEQDIAFDIKVPEDIGVGKLTIKARSGQHYAEETIDIDVRASSPMISTTLQELIPSKGDKKITFEPFGIPSTQSAEVTLSKGLNFSFVPFVNRLSRYPHGCLEQTVSSVFPQLFLYKMNILDETELLSYRQKYEAAIQKLRYMQTPSGGFSYWSGGNIVNNYATTYALDFLIEAKRMGYVVPKDMLKKLINYQYKSADNWKIASTNSSRRYSNTAALTQAYKLFTLAKAGKPNYAAMNRLRLVPQLQPAAQWLLGYALMKVGEKHAADEIINSATTDIPKYKELGGSFGSNVRDQAFIIRVLLDRGEKLKAKRLIDELVPYFNGKDNKYLSTQEISQCLISFSKFVDKLENVEEPIPFDIKMSKTQVHDNVILTKNPVNYKLDESSLKNKEVSIDNKGNAEMYASIMLSGMPARDESDAEAQDMTMQINYLRDGEAFDPKTIKKGTDFVVEYIIKHKGERMNYDNMALSVIFPSGWEIINHKLHDTFGFNAGSAYDYQDIRDDRAYTYFSLPKAQKLVYRFKVNASYAGKYWMPSAFCEAMYDPSIRAKSKGFWTEVE